MAIILIYLHGKRPQALSNQLRQSKAMSPDYSVRWWHDKGYDPPDIDPVAFLETRIEWRYKFGTPKTQDSSIRFGDSTSCLKAGRNIGMAGCKDGFRLLFTSPPYYGITNYHYDQWLRIWMLGGPPRPSISEGCSRKKFESKKNYARLLESVFTKSADMMLPDAVAYVRTDARQFTKTCTLEALSTAFPNGRIAEVPRPYSRKTQTALFGDFEDKPGDVDLIVRLSGKP